MPVPDALEFFIDPGRCIGCQACIQACTECNTHKGQSMIQLDYVDRTMQMHRGGKIDMHNKYPVKTQAPCEGTSYEVGGIALVKGARNMDNAKKYYDWLMSPEGQAVGAQVGSYQVPANKTFKMDPRIPTLDNVKLIKYDFEKYGKAAERRRLIDRWTKEVEALPR